MRRLDAAGLALSDLALRRPTLDDVFLTLTGQAATTRSIGSTSHRPTKAGAAADKALHDHLVPRRTWTLAISDTAVMTRRYLYHYLRKPSLLAIALAQPVLFVLLWTYVFSGAIQTPAASTTSTTSCPACSSWPSPSARPTPASAWPTTSPAA